MPPNANNLKRSRQQSTFLAMICFVTIVVALTTGIVVLAETNKAAPVYSVAEVRDGLSVHPSAWIGRTVLVRGRVVWLGGLSASAWLTDVKPQTPRSRHLSGGVHPGQWIPFTQLQQQSLSLVPGSWQTPSFPYNLVWWLSNNLSGLLRGDGGRVAVYRITLTKKAQALCPACPVDHG